MDSEILKIAETVKLGQSSARREVEKAIAAAKDKDELHALLEILEDEALVRADEIDLRIKNGEDVGMLAGVPYVAKDNFLTITGHTTAAAKILENFKSPLNATAIERLNDEGAILIGKANLDAFAHGGSTENSAYGPTSNAINPERVAGGSSGGSAVIVASGVVPFALGSDTGGSIRQPASFNGVVGFKPTYGMISRYGVVAMASSTDVVGPITRTVADAELLSNILAGPDGKDSTVHANYFNIKAGKTKVVILHGTSGSPTENWFPYIKKELESLGADVYIPQLPLRSKQNLNNWRKALRDQVPFELDENTILIGHSVGASFMLSLLNERRESALKASIFVSGFYDSLQEDEIQELVKTFVDLEFDWNLIRNNAGQIVQLHGDDDPHVPLEQAKRLSDKIKSNLVIIPKGGHLNRKSGYVDQFPELNKVLKNILKPAYKVSQSLKIGLVREFVGEGVDSEVIARTKNFVEQLKAAGHTVEEVDLPMAKYSLAIYYIVVPAEVSSNLARYDGVRYGMRSEIAKSLDDVYGQSRDQGFMPENKRRIMIGSYVLSSGYFDAYYLQAQKARTLLIQEFDKLFSNYDFLIGPTAPTPAFRLGENTADPIKMYLADAMTVPPSLAGLPAISLPNGTNTQGLPIGIQIIGCQKDDARLLSFAKTMEVKNV